MMSNLPAVSVWQLETRKTGSGKEICVANFPLVSTNSESNAF